MAARTNLVVQVSLVLVLLVCFTLVFEQQCSQYYCLSPLDQSTSFSPSLLPRYAGSSITSHLCEWERSRWQFSIIRSLVRGRETLLQRCGDVERNPGPATPAEKKQKMDFLTVIHVNTCSLLRHLDDVAALVAAEHPHILALSETWLDTSVTDAEIHLPSYSLFRFDEIAVAVVLLCSALITCLVLC